MSDVAQDIEAALRTLEAAAEAATRIRHWPEPRAEWTYDGNPSGHVDPVGGISSWDEDEDGGRQARHIAANDPAAVLRMVAGLRAVVALHRPFECSNVRCAAGLHCHTCEEGLAAGDDPVHHPCPTLTALAAALGTPVGGARVGGEG